MKTRLLTIFIVLILLGTNLPSTKATTLCGPRYLGKIIVVDEDNIYLKDAKVFRFNSSQDSNELGSWRRRHYEKTGRVYQGADVYESWWYSDKETPSNYRYAIHAEGYADVYIKNLDFSLPTWSDSTPYVYPVLFITMHAAKFVKTENQISKVTRFNYEETLQIKDTTYFNIIESEEYKESTREAQSKSKISADYTVKTFPNPVVEIITIAFKETPELPQKMVLFSIDGKKLKEYTLPETSNKVNLNWLSNGVYLILLYDEDNNPIHQEKLTKT